MEIIKAIKEALIKLKDNQNVEVAGQNSNLNSFKNVWLGKPEWQTYNVRLPNGNHKKEKYKTMNLPRYITRAWANNYANENTVISIPNQSSNERLQEILIKNNFWGKWNNFVESMMGLGIGAMVENLDKWYYQDDRLIKGDSDIKIQFVRGERIYPITIDDGEVTECAFVTYRTGGCKLVIHWLNEDGKYNISEINATGTNGAYNFDLKNITTAVLNSDVPLFQVWTPNITQDNETECGTSIFSKAYDAFAQCDVDYTALFKEIKLGGKIKYISTDIQNTNTNGEVETGYDINDESIFVVEKGNVDKPDFKTYTDEFRVQQLIASINFNMNMAAMLCGLGSNQFEFDSAGGRPIQTATGVIAKQTELYRNVIKQENYATSKLKDLVKAIAFLNNNYTNSTKIAEFKDSDVQITYDDNIIEDTASKRKSDLEEVNAGVMSIAEYRAEWYDEDLDSAKEFLQENGMLIEKYILALQSHVITPEMYVDLAFGENYKYKTELVEYINQNYIQAPQEENNSGFEDEVDE